MSIKKLKEFIKRRNNFLLTTHTSPEGDALGSELAMALLLKALGNKVCIVNQDRVPLEYSFLPRVKDIRICSRGFNPKGFDCLVILDCSDLKRCGEILSKDLQDIPILNIDHHISNVNFGVVNWVDPKASACSEMVYRLYKDFRIKINKEIATLLYAGIMTDTGSFRYSNTTARTHAIVSELVGYGLDIPGIYKNIYGSIPVNDAMFLAKILPTMKLEFGGKLAWFEIKRGFLEKHNTNFDIAENILAFGRSIKGVEVVILFRELIDKPNTVRVNFRSQGNVDVNKIAGSFGGGGHKTASGCTVAADIRHVRNIILHEIKPKLNNK